MATTNAPPYHGTRLRPVRVEDELWNAAVPLAAKHGTSASEIMRDALAEFVAEHTEEG